MAYASANVVVGRPINLLSVLLSSTDRLSMRQRQNPPAYPPVRRQSDAFQCRGEIGFAQILIGNCLPLCLVSSAANCVNVQALCPPVRKPCLRDRLR